ncbi:MAG: arylesterase [Agarilytica sp.]
MALGVLLLLPTDSYSLDVSRLEAPAEKKILVLGDSLSAAYKLASEEGWVHLMQQRLNTENIAAKVVNASVSGATTAAGLQLLPAALEEHQPDYVILELGANDGLQGKPVPYIRKNLERLILQSQRANAQVILVGIQLPPNFGQRYTVPFFAIYAELAKAHDLALVHFLLDGVAGKPELMMSDGLHPNALAQPKVLENVWGAVIKLLSETSRGDT